MLTRILTVLMIVGMLLTPGTSATATTTSATTTAAVTSPARQQVSDQFIVVIKTGRNARAVATAAGVTPKHMYRRALNGFVATLTAGQRAGLEHHPDVAWIEPDQLIEATSMQVLNLTTTPGLWGLDRIDQRALPLSGSYGYEASGAGVTAYLIDSGVQTSGTRAQSVYDVFGGSGADCHGHGTHLAGILGGTTYGVAKQVNLRSVRVLDCNAQGTVGNAIAGIDWVTANAVKPAVATITFSPVNLDSGNSGTLQLAVENLISAGVFVTVSAGNGNVDACTVAPASVAAAFTVAASTSSDSRASFSNFGACVDSYAPGSGITSTWINSTTNTLSGTSQATAFVAGVAALYKSSAGDQPQAAVNDWLTMNATPDVIQGNLTDTPNRLLYSPSPPLPPVTRSFVSAGYQHTCAARMDQTVVCWGSNSNGQTTPPSGSFTQIGAGYWHTCGVRTDQTVVCWGRNTAGQAAPPSGSFTHVSGGEQHTCAVRTNQTLACWGSNSDGQATPPSGSFTHVSAGNYHTCGVRTNQTLACWGRNRHGQATPPSGSFTQVSAGEGYVCAVRTDQTVVCWGLNRDGQATSLSGSFTQVSAGYQHTCAVRTNQTLACWGSNEDGQVLPPSGIFTQISAGEDHTCGVRTDQTLACWGDNTYGQAAPPSNF